MPIVWFVDTLKQLATLSISDPLAFNTETIARTVAEYLRALERSDRILRGGG